MLMRNRKEQEEAVKFLELHTNFMGKVDKGRCIRIPEENFTKTKQSLETVLNMLKENSAEIHQKNTELAEKNAEIEKLNRQIDLIAEEINETDRGYTDYCEMKIECDRNCKECIKQYFERIAEQSSSINKTQEKN